MVYQWDVQAEEICRYCKVSKHDLDGALPLHHSFVVAQHTSRELLLRDGMDYLYPQKVSAGKKAFLNHDTI